MYCKKCGCKLEEGSTLCPNCKNIQPQARNVQKIINNTITNTGNGRKSKFNGVTTFIAIISAGFIIYFMFFAPRPVNTVKKFINALNNKDMNTLITCMDPKYEKLYNGAGNIFSKFIGGINVKDVMDMFPAIYDLSKQGGNSADIHVEIKSVVSQQINGDNAVIVVNIYGKNTDESGIINEGPGQAAFYLTKFSEGWRIVDIK